MTTHTGVLAVAEKSYWPTKKWWAATITGVGGILVTLTTTGWNMTAAMQGAVITLVTQRVVAYVVPNDDTAGGVPPKKT